MMFHYIDAENTGGKAIEKLDVSILDRVFVFSNSKLIKPYFSGTTNNLVCPSLNMYGYGTLSPSLVLSVLGAL